MDSAEKEISIKVTIGDRQYPLKIEASEEEYVRKAAKLINEKSKFYQENFQVKDKQDSLAMAALEFASELTGGSLKASNLSNLVDTKLREFTQLIDEAL